MPIEQRRWPLQDFDALDIGRLRRWDIRGIQRVVDARAILEYRLRGVEAAYGELFLAAVTRLKLGDPGNVAQRVIDVIDLLILQQILGNNADCRRSFQLSQVQTHGRRLALISQVITTEAVNYDLLKIQVRLGPCVLRSRAWRRKH